MVVCSQEINVLSHRLDSTRFHFNVSLNITANDKRRVLTDINQTVILESYCTCKIWKVKKRSRKIFIQRFNFCLFFLSNMFLEYYFSSCEWFLYCGTIVSNQKDSKTEFSMYCDIFVHTFCHFFSVKNITYTHTKY